MSTDYTLEDIRANTRISAAPRVPEILLHLLDQAGPWSAHGRSVFADDGPMPYWAFAWGSGQALARYLLDRPDTVAGKRVFDFGSGSGIVAIAAALAGAASVVASEIDPLAVQAIALNAELNHTAVQATLAQASPASLNGIDIFLAADTFFHWPGNETMLLEDHRLERILIANPPRRAYPKGRELPAHLFTELATYEGKAYPELEPDFVNKAVVYELHKRG